MNSSINWYIITCNIRLCKIPMVVLCELSTLLQKYKVEVVDDLSDTWKWKQIKKMNKLTRKTIIKPRDLYYFKICLVWYFVCEGHNNNLMESILFFQSLLRRDKTLSCTILLLNLQNQWPYYLYNKKTSPIFSCQSIPARWIVLQPSERILIGCCYVWFTITLHSFEMLNGKWMYFFYNLSPTI